MVLGQARRERAEQELSLEHLAVIGAHELVRQADRAVEEAHRRVAHGGLDAQVHEGGRGGEDDLGAVAHRRADGVHKALLVGAVLVDAGPHDAAEVLIEVLAAQVMRVGPTRGAHRAVVYKAHAQRLTLRVRCFSHKEVKHARDRGAGRRDRGVRGSRVGRLHEIDLLVVVHPLHHELAPNPSEAIDHDGRRDVEDAVLRIDAQVNEHGVGGRDVQVGPAGALIGAREEEIALPQVVHRIGRPRRTKIAAEGGGQAPITPFSGELDVVDRTRAPELAELPVEPALSTLPLARVQARDLSRHAMSAEVLEDAHALVAFLHVETMHELRDAHGVAVAFLDLNVVEARPFDGELGVRVQQRQEGARERGLPALGHRADNHVERYLERAAGLAARGLALEHDALEVGEIGVAALGDGAECVLLAALECLAVCVCHGRSKKREVDARGNARGQCPRSMPEVNA